jgi:uroporphyrinogen decarboxylase
MTNEQWERLLEVIGGAEIDPLPVGFIIDSPWLPGWAGMTIMDYYTSEQKWLESNLQAIRRFPDAIFLPGFWSEWGMCTEPPSFGARCVWQEDEFPFADNVSTDLVQLASLDVPDPRQHGMTPFVLKRLAHCRDEIERAGHSIRFAVARGPLNIAGFLAGNTELLLGIKMQPEAAHTLIDNITTFLVDWIQCQAETITSIDGIFILDDLVGFLGQEDFEEFAKPYLKKVFAALDASVRFFHNDAQGRICAPHLAEIGINLFNFAYEHSMSEMRQWTGEEVTLLGNIPPRNVLAQGNPEDVRSAVRQLLNGLKDRRRVILSCGGGMSPGVPTENIEAFLTEARSHAIEP